MDYKPTEREKNLAAAVQMFSILFFFIPGMAVAGSDEGKRSPYLRYWTRISIAWSIFVIVLFGIFIAFLFINGSAILCVLTGVIHVLACVMGAVSSVSMTPFQYFGLGGLLYRRSMAEIWYQHRKRIREEWDVEDDDPEDNPYQRPPNVSNF